MGWKSARHADDVAPSRINGKSLMLTSSAQDRSKDPSQFGSTKRLAQPGTIDENLFLGTVRRSGETGHQNDGQTGTNSAQVVRQRNPTHPWHYDVAQYAVELLSCVQCRNGSRRVVDQHRSDPQRIEGSLGYTQH
jgi:hypothetical protein